jgi:16S rRNA (cytosine967-C5)-methyltransferase
MIRRPSAGTSRTRTQAASVPSGRVEQVELVLKKVLTWRLPADQVLSSFFKEYKQLGARDRSEIAQALFNVLRHLRRYRREAQSGQGSLEGLLAVRGLAATLEEGRSLAVLSAEQAQWVAHCESIDPQTQPFAVRYSLPDWLAQALQALAEPSTLAEAMLCTAALDLRVNLQKANRDEVLAKLQAMLEGSAFSAEPTPYAPTGIRLKGHPPLNRWEMYEKGFVEVQDEGSQLLAELVAPKRGEMVIDFCAGAGGKTLALGAMMRSTGRLYAFDISAPRLAKAKPRVARSGLSNVHPVVIRSEQDDRVSRLAGKAHRVLIDAPCTGVGTLRRNPDLKWRLAPEELSRLLEQQASILRSASRCVRPGGRLVYATCSFLPQENEGQVNQFLESHPDFELVDANSCLPVAIPNAVGEDGMMRLRPDWHQTDGFFAAVMQKKASST